MREREEKKKKVASDDRRARNIPSKQDKSWVGEQQMQQEQFDKTEFEEREAEKTFRRRRYMSLIWCLFSRVIKTYYPRVIFTIRIVCLLKILS